MYISGFHKLTDGQQTVSVRFCSIFVPLPLPAIASADLLKPAPVFHYQEEEVVIRQELYKAAIRSLSQMKRREQMSVGAKKYFILLLRSLVTAPIVKATVSFQSRDMKSVLGEGEGGVVRGGRGAGEVLR